MNADLLITAGRVYRGTGEVGGPSSVAVTDGRISYVGDDFQGTAARELSFPNDLLLPGLVDLHCHPAAFGESKYGTIPDQEFLTRGVTTVMSQGDAGANNWDSYCENTIAKSKTRIFMAINLAASGEVPEHGCFERLEDIDVDACIGAINGDNAGPIWGIAINVSRIAAAGTDPKEIMRRGLQVAEATGKPILYGMREPSDWPLTEQLGQLRSGDVITYCYRPPTVTIVQNGRVDPAVWDARERGVLFDVGHGWTSFNYENAELAIGEGFLPDTISTDQYAMHNGSSPKHDLPLTMSKLMAAGLQESDVLPRVTSRPAEVLGVADEVGTIAEGRVADLCVLGSEANTVLLDTGGEERTGTKLEAVCVVRAGEVIVDRSEA